MKDAPLRHRVEYAFYRLAKTLVLRLPHASVRQLGHGLGRLGYRLLRSPRRQVLANLELVLPELGAEEHRRIARACFAHFGGHFLELLSAVRFERQSVAALFDTSGWEHLRLLEESGEPYFLTAGHYGNWELAAYPLALAVARLQLVARPPDNPHIDADLRRQRSRFGAGIIDKAGASHRMLNALRRGGRVAIVIDQHVRPSAGIRVPFLGRPAWTSPVLAMLSLRTGAPVVPFRCTPSTGGRYRLELKPPILPEGEGEEAVAAMTYRYLEPVEQDIRARPELWLWMHRRWRA